MPFLQAKKSAEIDIFEMTEILGGALSLVDRRVSMKVNTVVTF